MPVATANCDTRELNDLISVGPRTCEDFEVLGIKHVADLVDCNADGLYEKLCVKTGHSHDVCCRDVFSAAIAQAKDPNLPLEKCQWWYWSRLRRENK